MGRFAQLAATLIATVATGATAEARTVCTIVADAATGQTLIEEGNCQQRVTPASTFKVALAVIGFDSGFLRDAATPKLAYTKDDPDWGGAHWRVDTTPLRWMKYSVVWYSQRVTRALGEAALTRYGVAFNYGNANFSGDPGEGNGLELSWISSSLQISPREQQVFLRRLVNSDLPVSGNSMTDAKALLPRETAGGWDIAGKTGGAYPRLADGSLDRAHGWGWFVGWATRGPETLVFVQLAQDEVQIKGSPGIRTRDAFLAAWPDLATSLGR